MASQSATARRFSSREDRAGKLRVAILGTGNLGTDLLIKCLRSETLSCVMFAGRNARSTGIARARSLGIRTSSGGIQEIVSDPDCCDIVFDATSAADHRIHAPILRRLGMTSIDMTPSQLGIRCIPAINLRSCLARDDINMITCGGQSAIPIVHALMGARPEIRYVEVVSSISSRSAGPGTRSNIDEYIENTEAALREIAGCPAAKVILNLNPAIPCVDMQTTVLARLEEGDASDLRGPIERVVKRIRRYVPGYELVVPPTIEDGRLMIMVRVRGSGDHLPAYAGNLDIINCAGLAVAEEIARTRREEAPS